MYNQTPCARNYLFRTILCIFYLIVFRYCFMCIYSSSVVINSKLLENGIRGCRNVAKMNLVAFVFLINFISRSKLIIFLLFLFCFVYLDFILSKALLFCVVLFCALSVFVLVCFCVRVDVCFF